MNREKSPLGLFLPNDGDVRGIAWAHRRIGRMLMVTLLVGMMVLPVPEQAQSQEPSAGRLVPLYETGPELWESPLPYGDVLTGRITGPIVMQLTGLFDTLVIIRTLDPETGRPLVQFNDLADPRYRYHNIKSTTVSSDGIVVAIAADSRNDSVPTLGGLRTYDTQTGERLSRVDGNGTRVYAVSRQHDRLVVWTETDQDDVGVIELRSLSTYDRIASIPGIQADRATFDEFTGEVYITDRTTVHRVRASDGALLGSYGTPYEVHVARLRGTDTLVAAGSATDEQRCEVILINMKTKRVSHVFADDSPDRSRFNGLPSLQVQASPDGDTVYISGLGAREPNQPNTFPILFFERDRGMQIYSEGIYRTGELNGRDFVHIAFLTDRLAALGGWVAGPPARQGLLAFSIVPKGTSSADVSGAEQQPITLQSDGRIATCSDPSATIKSIHDMQGRQMPLRCLDESCSRVDVQSLPTATYLVRASIRGQEGTYTMALVR
jgi:hypothetical protein